jgi:hypothetical protein
MKTATTPVILLLALLAASCGSNNSTTTPTTPAAPSTEVFTGTLAPQGSSFYSFTVTNAGQVSITLASLVAKQPGPAQSTVMALGVGMPSGTDCAVTNSVTTAPGLSAQLVTSLTPGTYCATISDVGGLAGAADFAVRIVHP